MKKFYVLICVLALGISSFANNAGLFDLDESKIEKEFAELNELENYIRVNNSYSLEEISNVLKLQSSAIDLNAMHLSSASDLDFQWEGFLWGFLCCPVGFFVVAVNDNKTRDDKMSFWIGVGASAVLSAITSPIYYASY